MDAEHANDLAELTAEIVAAYVSNNSVSREDLPTLIADIHSALVKLPKAGAEPEPEPQEPAVPIRTSVKPDSIVCLEDGKKFKSLRRHLRTDHDLTPEEYRAKWGLKTDYPMVAPNYAKARSELAKSMGLGRKSADAGASQAAESPPKPARRGKAAEAEPV